MNFDMPPGTQGLIIANAGIYLLQLLAGNELLFWFALWPWGDYFSLWQLVSYSFLHGGLMHIFFNMLLLLMFGGEIERLFGTRWFLQFYAVSVIVAALTHLAVAAVINAPPYPTIGASGGVFGVLLAFGMYFPHRRVMLLFPPIPLPAWLLVTGYGVLELFFGITGYSPGIAHFAHLGGMIGGFAMIAHRRGWWGKRRRR